MLIILHTFWILLNLVWNNRQQQVLEQQDFMKGKSLTLLYHISE